MSATGKIVRGPAVSTNRGVPVFQGRSGILLANNSLLSIDKDDNLVPRTTTQTLGVPNFPFQNIYFNSSSFYEEGTFLPEISCPVLPENLSISYTCRSGTYRRIGGMVFLNLRLAIANIALNGASGYAYFQNLPFTGLDTSVLNIEYQIINTPGATIGTVFEVQKDLPRAIVIFNEDASANDVLLITALSNGDSIHVSGVYAVGA